MSPWLRSTCRMEPSQLIIEPSCSVPALLRLRRGGHTHTLYWTGAIWRAEGLDLLGREGDRLGVKPLTLGKTIRAERELMVYPWSSRVLHGSQNKAHTCLL